ncbi:hypothetical protein NDU88_002975 [Pleurodeles waltl]|uniref:Uncharacterized protein n=1 Tax=Pleurodeles waltl TaxID=8319 RepID=A0AAV7KXA5_PLEWA|nr:hypothetical protein NDU88_002975 [Pleurodeles waltl]
MQEPHRSCWAQKSQQAGCCDLSTSAQQKHNGTASRELPGALKCMQQANIKMAIASMAGYEDQAEELYYMDDNAGSFDQDLVYALDAGVPHSVNQALAQGIQPIKHHLLGLVDQQGWVAPVGAPPIGESPFAASTQAAKQSSNPHAADFESLIRNMAREHDYDAGAQKKAVSDPASSSSSSEHSSEQGDVPPRKHKK